MAPRATESTEGSLVPAWGRLTHGVEEVRAQQSREATDNARSVAAGFADPGSTRLPVDHTGEGAKAVDETMAEKYPETGGRPFRA